MRAAKGGLAVSFLLLATAPLLVGGSYSIVDHTLSEAAGQGVAWAWFSRIGVIAAAVSVTTLTFLSGRVWTKATRAGLRLYTLGLVFLVVFPESPYFAGSYHETIATLHSVAGFITAIGFIFAMVASASSRPAGAVGARVFDLVVAAAIVVLPQVMLVAPGDGLWQRLMVGLGYVWLFLESGRIAREGAALD